VDRAGRSERLTGLHPFPLLTGVLLVGAALAGCNGQEAPAGTRAAARPASPEEAAAPASAAAPSSAVVGRLLSEGHDDDGDGTPDRWVEPDPAGGALERRDTDGDGTPDVERRLEELEPVPEGLPIR